jgi:potassium-transporting ATPase KdpC subunit
MLTEIRNSLRPAFVLLFLFTLLTGVAYPLVITGLAQTLFPSQANGSLIRDGGQVRGSALIGQNFVSARYFHGRPSAAGKGYDASASAASNLAPGSSDLAARIQADVARLRAEGVVGNIPVDLVTTSASGLDPHISPEAAALQVRRVAKARGLSPQRLQALIVGAQEYPALTTKEPRVNVLMLNRQLDLLSAKPAQ